jgi:phage baseplate assembly protein W
MARLSSPNATYSDFDMNFMAHPVTGDLGRVKDVESIKRSMINLLMTAHYERPFHPEIGGNIRASLFEPFTEFTEDMLKLAIVEVLQNFESRVTLDGVNVEGYPDENGFKVRIDFYIENVASVNSIETFLERVR